MVGPLYLPPIGHPGLSGESRAALGSAGGRGEGERGGASGERGDRGEGERQRGGLSACCWRWLASARKCLLGARGGASAEHRCQPPPPPKAGLYKNASWGVDI